MLTLLSPNFAQAVMFPRSSIVLKRMFDLLKSALVVASLTLSTGLAANYLPPSSGQVLPCGTLNSA